MPKEIFTMIESATSAQGVKVMNLLGAQCEVEWQMGSVQNRKSWQIEIRPPNRGAATFDLACNEVGVLLLAVANSEPINLQKHAGTSQAEQKELALKILSNLIRYGLTEIRVVKHDKEVLSIPVLGERDAAAFEDTKTLNVDPPRRFRIYHYAPYARSGESDSYEHVKEKEPIEWGL